jgi:TetR/AcrR family transcriptional repressor of mexCD-oprJ operon
MNRKETRPVRVSSEEALLLAARVVFQKNPGASLDDVAAAAGVGRATLFRHFKTKTELQRAVFVRALHEVEQAIEALGLKPVRGTAKAQLSLLLRTLLSVGGELRYILSAAELFEEPSVVAAAERVYAHVDPVFVAAIREGVLRDDVPLDWLRSTAEAVLHAAWFEIEAGRLARNAAPALVEATLLHGIGRPTDAARPPAPSKRSTTRAPAKRPAPRRPNP